MAKPGQVTISASATDSAGVQRVSLWNVGAPFTDTARAEVVNPPEEAYRFISTLAMMNVEPGQEIGVFASARNFNSGTDPATSTALTPLVVVEATGILEQLPPGTRTEAIPFRWSDDQRAYVSPGVPAPAPGAEAIAVSVDNPFGGGSLVSLYRGGGDIETLDLRADFVRVFQLSRADFFLGPWSAEPWYALRNFSRTRGFADEFTIDVHWRP